MSLEDLMKVLYQEYVTALPEKFSVIETQIQAGVLPPLRDSFHKLKGTGLTYGLPEVSTLGELVEDICVKSPDNAFRAAQAALLILRDIHRARQQSQAYDCTRDPRFSEIRKLLQK